MKLVDCLRRKCDDESQKNIREFLSDFVQKDFSSSSPDVVFREYFRGRNSIFSRINSQLVTYYSPVVNPGFKLTDKFFVSAIRNVSIISIVAHERNCGKIISENVKKTKSTCIFQKYDRKYFSAILQIIVAMHLEKYEVGSLCSEHLIYMGLCTLWYFFRIYDDNVNWLIETKDVFPVVSEVMQIDMQYFKAMAEKYGFAQKSFTESEKFIMTAEPDRRPQNIDELMSFISDDMTQTQKKRAIMDRYFVGDRTARKIMAEFGLTNKKYERSDYAEIHRHIDERADQIDDHIDEVSEQIEEVSGKVDGIGIKIDVLHEDFNIALNAFKKAFLGKNAEEKGL